MDNIKVGIRVRPLLPREKASGSQWISSGNSISQRGASSTTPYYFDHVFEGDISTVEVYEILAKPIVLSVMEGFNGTIFAYGQTSSGKTHTMMGDEENYGIIPHSIGEVFDFIEKSPEREFLICASYLEIYNETLTDLLDPSNKHLKIRENSERNVIVNGLTEHPVTNVADVGMIIAQGEEYRSVGETQMNDRSSRSHTIFTLTVESRLIGEEVEDKAVKVAALNLVDLAGSERPSATGAEGIRFTEGTFINKSLLVLGNVISKLSEGNSSHIPFRDSKLTRILQTSLGGNAKTCIICTVTPAEKYETHSTLKFASRAKNIKNKPVVNEIVIGEEALKKKLKKYERENEQLKKKLEEGLSAQERQQLTELIDQKEKERSDIEARMKALEDIIVKSSSSSGTPRDGHIKEKEKNEISRRRTICPGNLSRDLPRFSPLPLTATKPPVAPLVRNVNPPNRPLSTPAGNRRVTFAPSPSFVSPFVVKFDRDSFDKHLSDVNSSQENEPSPSRSYIVNRRRAGRLKSRLSFLPPMNSSTPESCLWEDSLNSTTCTAVMESVVTKDVQVQTSPVKDPPSLSSEMMVETQTQTDPQAPPTPRPLAPQPRIVVSSPLDMLHRSCSKSSGLNNSLCVHRTESMKAIEKMETMQFEVDENALRIEELERLLLESEKAKSSYETLYQESQSVKDTFQQKIKDMEMASEAQEELLIDLQSRLKQANIKIHRSEEVNQDLLSQLETMETSDKTVDSLRTELQEAKDQLSMMDSLHTELQQAKDQLTFRSTEDHHLNETRIVQLTAEVTELRSQLQVMGALQLELDEAKREIELHSHDEDVPVSLSSELNEARITELTQELQESQETIGVLQLELSKAKEKADQCRDEWTHKMKVACCELKDTKEEILDLKKQLDEANTMTQCAEGELKVTRDELEDLRCVIQDRDETINMQNKEIESLKEGMETEALKMEKDRGQFVQDSQQMAQQVTDLKAQLLSWQRKIEDTPPVTANNDDSLEVELLNAKLVEMEIHHEQETQDFQRMYKLKVDEANRAGERVCQLEEELEGLREKDTLEQSTQSDRYHELEELIRERESTIQKLNDKCAAAQDEAHRMWTEHEEKLTEAQTNAKDFKCQLKVLSERLSSQDAVCEELRASLADAREKLEDGETQLKQAIKDKKEAMWHEDQIETKCSLLENDMEDLQEELKQKKSLIEHQEQQLVTLKQDTQVKLQTLQEKVTISDSTNEELKKQLSSVTERLSSQDAVCEELRTSLADAREKLEESETQLKQAIKDKNEAVWYEDQIETKCSLLENDMEDLQEEVKHKTTHIEKLESEINILKQYIQERMETMAANLAHPETDDLKKQVAELTERLSSQDAVCEELKSSLADAREKLEDGETQLKQAIKDKNEAMWHEDQIETKCSLLENDLEDLQEELKQKKYYIDQLEKDIETMKQEAQVLYSKEDSTVKELHQQLAFMSERLSSQDAVCEELKSSLADAREKLEDGETQLKQAIEDKNEAMWHEDQIETKCSLLENDIEDLQEELKSKQATIAELESAIESLKQDTQEREVGNCTTIVDFEVLSDKEKKGLIVKLQRDLEYLTRKCSVLDEFLTEKENLLSTSNEKLTEAQRNHSESISEMNTKLKSLEEENKVLRLRIQGLACIPAPPTEPVVDGSGAITGLAYYQMGQELRSTKNELNEVKDKYQKLKVEFKEKLVHGQTIEDMKRYRDERNILMKKYEQLKRVCSCGAKEKIRRDAASAVNLSLSSAHKSDTLSHESVKLLPPPPITPDDPLPSPHPHKALPITKTAPTIPHPTSMTIGQSSFKQYNYKTTSTMQTDSSNKTTIASSKVEFSIVSSSKVQPSSFTSVCSSADQTSAPNGRKHGLFSYKFPPTKDQSSLQSSTKHYTASLWSTNTSTTRTSPPATKKMTSQTMYQDTKAASSIPAHEDEKILSSKFPSTNDMNSTSSSVANKHQSTTTSQSSASLMRSATTSSREKSVAGKPPLSGGGTGENVNPAFLDNGLEERSKVKKRKFFWEDSILDMTQSTMGCVDKHEDHVTNNDCKTQ